MRTELKGLVINGCSGGIRETNAPAEDGTRERRAAASRAL